jgi:UDP-N-acetyl-D-glucosamine dehydrogenase
MSFSIMHILEQKIRDKSAKLGVIGLGYVGLPLAVEKAMAGYSVIGFDIQKEKVDLVNQGKNYIGDVISDDLSSIVAMNKLMATSDYKFIADCDAISICVPTPLDIHQQPDLSFIELTAKAMVPYLRQNQLITLESTTYPGTTEEFLKPILEESGLVCGIDFFLAFSPERVDPGNKLYKTKNTPKVVGGVTKECTQIAAALYSSVLDADILQVSSPAIAEMEKILENTYRNINIGLINELAMLAHKMNIDIWEVIEAAKTKPFGFQAFYPGPGLGGHCIPLDPYYLAWKAREYGFHTSMIESSMMINDGMPDYVVNRASAILNRFQKPLNGSKILILGVAYKQDIDDYRESPAIRVIEGLLKHHSNVDYYDPFVPTFKHGTLSMNSIDKMSEEILSKYDLVMITTSHSNVDYQMVLNNSTFVFDTKNATKNCHRKDNVEIL